MAAPAPGASMSQRGKIRVPAIVKESLPNALFRAELESGELVLAHVAEPLSLHCVRVIPGLRVTLEISPLDLGRGRIVALGRGGPSS